MSTESTAKPDATSLAVKRTDLADQRTDMAERRTHMADIRTRWAADRTLWAADRTFIAWLRTAISMIGFGISIGKAGDALQHYEIIKDDYQTLQLTGLIFIGLAVVGLAGALVQNYKIQRRLSDEGFGRVEPVPLGMTMGLLVLGFGLVGAVFIFL